MNEIILDLGAKRGFVSFGLQMRQQGIEKVTARRMDGKIRGLIDDEKNVVFEDDSVVEADFGLGLALGEHADFVADQKLERRFKPSHGQMRALLALNGDDAAIDRAFELFARTLAVMFLEKSIQAHAILADGVGDEVMIVGYDFQRTSFPIC